MSALPSLRKHDVSPQKQARPKQRFEVDLRDYEQLSVLNHGSFGCVYKIRDKRSNQIYAAKVVNCFNDDKECERVISREVEIMTNIHHNTIVEYFGFSRYDFSRMNNVTILMEYAEFGSLRKLLNQVIQSNAPHKYDNTIRQIILIGISRGMKYLHDRSIIHRDLKPENVLICKKLHPHITDFGLSKFFEFGQSQNQSQNPGTPFYMAPEVHKGEKFGRKSDVYSFGLLMFEVVTDSNPFESITSAKLLKIIYEKVRPQFKYHVKDNIRELIEKCWDDDPNERPSFKEIFEKLSNIESDDFLLDDVDVNEVQIYLEDINNKYDPVENLLKEIEERQLKEEEIVKKFKENESELVKLRLENKQLKKMNENVKIINKKSKEYEREIEQLQACFNSLSLSKQKEICEIMSKAENCPKTELFIKMNKLISYLQKLKDAEKNNCIEISIDHKPKKNYMILTAKKKMMMKMKRKKKTLMLSRNYEFRCSHQQLKLHMRKDYSNLRVFKNR